MPINVKENELPVSGYIRLDYKGQIVMMSVVDNGPVFIFSGENEKSVFIPWKEIMEYAAVTPAEDPKVAAKEIKKPGKPA
jgi:hypothetical protein